ncbi:MAG: ComF family protein [Butyricicoccaceae bacterium]
MLHGSPPRWRRFSPRSSTGGSPPASHTCRSAFSAHGSAADNQAELLARPIAQSLSMPCVSALRKRPFTARQSVQQDAAARRKNAAGSLLPGRIPLAGERVVVIDDIITTGSTAADAAHVLRSMGAACVFVLAAAKAVN